MHFYKMPGETYISINNINESLHIMTTQIFLLSEGGDLPQSIEWTPRFARSTTINKQFLFHALIKSTNWLVGRNVRVQQI